MQVVFAFWNMQIGLVFDLLTESPTSFKGGGAWQAISNINPIFVAVGTSLVTLFFVIGFCSESIDVKEEMRFELVLRLLMRIGFAQWLVANNLTIMKAVFQSVGNLLKLIGVTKFAKLELSQEQIEIIRDLDFFSGIILMIIAVFLCLIVLICGFFMIYIVYFRVLRILVVLPFGSLAFATVAGNRGVTGTAVSYTKHSLSITLEAVAMMLAIIICNAFIASGTPAFAGDYEPWAKTVIYLAEMTFTVALTVASLKGAQSLVKNIIG